MPVAPPTTQNWILLHICNRLRRILLCLECFPFRYCNFLASQESIFTYIWNSTHFVPNNKNLYYFFIISQFCTLPSAHFVPNRKFWFAWSYQICSAQKNFAHSVLHKRIHLIFGLCLRLFHNSHTPFRIFDSLDLVFNALLWCHQLLYFFALTILHKNS